jgi:hypothetical protein
MIQLSSIERAALKTDPYGWAKIDGLFTRSGGAALAAAYPREVDRVVEVLSSRDEA